MIAITRSLAGLSACWIVAAAAMADETPDPAAQVDRAALGRMIHKAVVSQMPKVIETQSGWGETIPMPERLRLRGLRQAVPVGDHLELPHGHWRKVRAWMDNPERDLKITVLDLHRVDGKKYHLTLDADAPLHTESDIQQWQRGLRLLDVTARADVKLALRLDCDVALTLDTSAFPPSVKIEPTITDLKPELKDLKIRRIDGRHVSIALGEQPAREAGSLVRGVLQDAIRHAEPQIKERANEAIARSLREGKGTLSAGAMLKALTPGKAK
jgi:hypothetical protein